MAKPAIVIVGADKGGVGKTTVARTLLDYFRAHQIGARAFDTEAPRGTLKRFHPEGTTIVDMAEVSDQMKIFDTITSSDPAVTVIDVRAGLLSPTLRALRDIGVLDVVKNGQITLVLFHILGPSIASLSEINEIADYLNEVQYVMVKNFINNSHFFEWDAATYSSYFAHAKDTIEIAIPKLNELASEQVELSSVPYLTFIANKKLSGEPADYSFVLRGYVRHWLGKVWGEYSRIGLVDIISGRGASGAVPPAPAPSAVTPPSAARA